MKKKKYQKLLDKAHLNALSILIAPLVECKSSRKAITPSDAYQILYDWDQARKVHK